MPAKTEIYIYFVFTPKYRKELLTDRVKDTIQWAITDQARQMDMKIIALSAKPDYLHLIVRLPPNISVAKAAQMLKWRSSIVARQRHRELNEIKAFWGVRYFARSISPMNLNKARQFVESR
jgi:putative transposase